MAELIITGRANMANLVGVTANGLVKMEERGLPVHNKTDNRNTYHLKTVMQWLKDDQARQFLQSHARVESITEIVRRRATADARKAEIEVSKLEASVGDLRLLKIGLDSLFVNIRTIFQPLPSLIGREIDDRVLRIRVETLVERQVREALDTIASYEPVIPDIGDAAGEDPELDSGESPPDPAAAKDQHQRVGRAKKISQSRRRRVRPVAQ